MDLGIAGKTALVTGGARSLGKQDCLTLAAEGCRIIVLDLNGEGAAEAAREITDAGGTARGYAADITERAVLTEVLRRAEAEVGPIDICVNNAGWIYTMGQLKDTAKTKEDVYVSIIPFGKDVNVGSANSAADWVRFISSSLFRGGSPRPRVVGRR